MGITVGWRFFGEGALDSPLMGVSKNGNGTTSLALFVTDGAGRVLVVADSNGRQSFGLAGWDRSGGTSNPASFGSDRMSAGQPAGLSYYRSRAYDMNTGRWMQEDPLGIAGGDNLYQFNGNNPVSYTDPFGLWPPKVHDQLIQHALSGIASGSDIRALQQASRNLDNQTQGTASSYMHSMRAPGQSSADAIKARDQFVASELNTASSLAADGDRAGALTHLGNAMHPVMDQSSPEHTDANGQPKEWSPISLGAVGHVVKEHFDQVTPEIQKSQDEKLQSMYDSVFGKPE